MTLNAVVDKTCDTYHYTDCTSASKCCGGFKCAPSSPGGTEYLCCPADTGCVHDVVEAFKAAMAR